MSPTAVAPDDDVDHYAVLGLPSGEEASRLTLKDIEKAYRNESRKRHPDKRPNDPNATADFQLLTKSFDVLRDEPARAAFDARLRSRRDRILRESQHDAKRRRFASDLDERERAAESTSDPASSAERNEKKIAAEIKRELAAFQARNSKKSAAAPPAQAAAASAPSENGAAGLDKERVLKVSWERDGGDYTAAKLRELFERFGVVEDVVIRSKKRRGSAVVVMSSKESAVAATRTMSGCLSNPLLVLPLHVDHDTSSTSPAKYSESFDPKLSKIVGAGLHDYEASILKKLEKADDGEPVEPVDFYFILFNTAWLRAKRVSLLRFGMTGATYRLCWTGYFSSILKLDRSPVYGRALLSPWCCSGVSKRTSLLHF